MSTRSIRENQLAEHELTEPGVLPQRTRGSLKDANTHSVLKAGITRNAGESGKEMGDMFALFGCRVLSRVEQHQPQVLLAT